jgi:hypothetical protein
MRSPGCITPCSELCGLDQTAGASSTSGISRSVLLWYPA